VAATVPEPSADALAYAAGARRLYAVLGVLLCVLDKGCQAAIDLHVTSPAEQFDIRASIVPGIAVLVVAIRCPAVTPFTFSEGVHLLRSLTFCFSPSGVALPCVVSVAFDHGLVGAAKV
jgi:hypothetical protein